MRLVTVCALIILTTLPLSAATPVAVWTTAKSDGVTLLQHHKFPVLHYSATAGERG